MSVTIMDVAERAKVSGTTVSLAFRPGSRISEETRTRIIAIAEEMGYVPNKAAQNLRGASRSLAFIVNDISNPFYALMIKTAEAIALKHGYELIIADSNWNARREEDLIRQMLALHVAGVMICFCEKSKRSIAILESSSVPFIALDNVPENYCGAYVGNDFESAVSQLSAYLKSRLCRHPVLFSSSEQNRKFSAFMTLEKQFAKEFAGAKVVRSGLTIESGAAAFRALMQEKIPFDALFCVNDLCAIGVMSVCKEYSLEAGRDFILIGIDDMQIPRVLHLPLHSIRQPYDRIARKAAAELINAIQNNRLPDIRLKLAPELKIRV